MDPQQRMLLEESWRCVEDSGIGFDTLRQKRTGVFIGIMALDYLQESASAAENTDAYACLGSYASLCANRISHIYGLRGMSFSLDAACASSLVAIHLAKQSLVNREIDFAVVGGASIDFHPWKFKSFSKSRMLSPQGKCRTFDSQADGYVPGEGVGVLLLQRLDDALEERSHIHAVIKGSAANHGGHTRSITAPSVQAQTAVIVSAYDDARLSPKDTSYTEAHGTGTSLGDPIEVESLTKAFRTYSNQCQYCGIGSVKTNIGHLEAVAGIAGVIKVVLMMKHTELVPTLNIAEINPIIRFDRTPFIIIPNNRPWKRINGSPLQSGVSSFGMGGANTHVVLQEPTPVSQPEQLVDEEKPQVFLLSAKSRSSLESACERWREFSKSTEYETLTPDGLCKTMATGREHFAFRFGCILNRLDDLQQRIATCEYTEIHTPHSMGFMFPQSLFTGYSDFAQILGCCSELQASLHENRKSLPINYRRRFTAAKWPERHRPVFSCIFGYTLADQIEKMGIPCRMVAAKGVGTWAALVYVGMLTLDQAISGLIGEKRISEIKIGYPQKSFLHLESNSIMDPICCTPNYPAALINNTVTEEPDFEDLMVTARSLLQNQFTFRKLIGEWKSVVFNFYKPEDIFSYLESDALPAPTGNSKTLLCIAVLHSLNRMNRKWDLQDFGLYENTSISEIVDLLTDNVLSQKDMVALILRGENEFNPICEKINKCTDRVNLHRSYKYLKQMCRPTLPELPDLLRDCSHQDTGNKYHLPHPFIVIGDANAGHDDENRFYVYKRDNPYESFLRFVLSMWRLGHNVHWEKLFPSGTFQRVSLPTYQFEGERFWIHDRENGSMHRPALRETITPPSGVIPERNVMHHTFACGSPPLSDHVINGRTLIPAAAYICLLGRMNPSKTANTAFALGNVRFLAPGHVLEHAFSVEVEKNEAGEIRLSNGSNILMKASTTSNASDITEDKTDYHFLDNQGYTSNFYEYLKRCGYSYGPSLRVIQTLQMQDGAYCFRLREENSIENGVSIALVDGLFQAAVLVALWNSTTDDSFLYIPCGLRHLQLHDDLANTCMAILPADSFRISADEFVLDLRGLNSCGKEIVRIHGLQLKRVPNTRSLKALLNTQADQLKPAMKVPVWLKSPYHLNPITVREQLPTIILSEENVGLVGGVKSKFRSAETVFLNLMEHSSKQVSQTEYFVPLLERLHKASLKESKVRCFLLLCNDNFTGLDSACKKAIVTIRLLFEIAQYAAKNFISLDLTIVTEHAYSIFGDEVTNGFPHASLGGMITCLSAELPSSTFRLIDVSSSPGEVEKIADFLFNYPEPSNSGESVVLKSDTCYKRYFLPVPPPNSEVPTSSGVIVITGGTGALGLRVADHILASGASQLVLLGRTHWRRLSESTRTRVMSLQRRSSVQYLQTDVTDFELLSSTLGEIRREFGAISGIVHCAGIVEDRLIRTKVWESFSRVLAPKIIGTTNLDLLTRDDPLKFFIVFSSIISITGNMAQSDYAAANAYLDSYIGRRSLDSNAPGVSKSINWSLWEGDGMASGAAIRQLSRLGIVPMRPEDAVRRTLEVLKIPVSQVAVEMGSALPPPPGLVKSFPSKQIQEIAVKSSNQDNDIVNFVQKVAAEVLDIPLKNIDLNVDFSDYGLDSIGIAEFVTRLSERYGDTIHHSALSEHPTVNLLANYLSAFSSESTSPDSKLISAGFAPSTHLPSRAIEETVREIVAQVSQIPPGSLNSDTEFSEYGIDSIGIADLIEQLEKRFEFVLNHSVVIDYPTITSLSRHLMSREDLPIQAQDSRSSGTGVRPRISPPGSNITPRDHTTKKSTLTSRSREGIAIIGIAARLPGSPTVDKLWANLLQGAFLVSDIPKERFDITPFFTPKMTTAHKTYSRWAGLIDNPYAFDADYFGVTEDDALLMDPQQRIMLELAQELFDNAGYHSNDLSGSSMGVFIGGHESNYGRKLRNRPKYFGRSGVTNVISNLIAGRIMNSYDLHGPVEMIYTACSSSLVSVHKACQSLALGECSTAIAGGIELILDEEWLVGFSASGVLSPEGKCKVFDRTADGFVLGEGAGLVLLKPLSEAYADGDRILATILGSAVNNDGKTMGLTTPNMQAQKGVIEAAQRSSGIRAGEISLYEAHGTGTALGDPIEVKAASLAYREQTQKESYCAIGSVKSNIGHSLAAAGIAGLIKVILSLQNRVIPPTINCAEPHPRFSFDTSPFYPALHPVPWPRTKQRHAAVSSFGFGGTNCHVILGDPDDMSYEPTRQPLPRTVFNRKVYRIDSSDPRDATEFLSHIFTLVSRGELTSGEAKQRVRDQGYN